jgi:hypothetical protein
MKALFIAIAAQGSSEDSDLVDEMLRQVQKSVSFEKDDPKKAQLLIGHPFLHRLLKDMVNAEATSTAGRDTSLALIVTEYQHSRHYCCLALPHYLSLSCPLCYLEVLLLSCLFY